MESSSNNSNIKFLIKPIAMAMEKSFGSLSYNISKNHSIPKGRILLTQFMIICPPKDHSILS